ncbi:MAG: hypothetical protein WB439_01675 [Acidobacteriaceae bacterium]
MAFLPAASSAQVSVGINIGGPPPTCAYGYYDYAPYSCAPEGYYGSGYFYNGVFLGVGPWAHWGYNHGWGHHRFTAAHGGRYVPGRRDPMDHSRPMGHMNSNHGHPDNHGHADNGHGDKHPH